MSQSEIKPLGTKAVSQGKKVRPKQPTTIYGTGSNRFLAAGQVKVVHAELAAKLIASGAATETAPAEKTKNK